MRAPIWLAVAKTSPILTAIIINLSNLSQRPAVSNFTSLRSAGLLSRLCDSKCLTALQLPS